MAKATTKKRDMSGRVMLIRAALKDRMYSKVAESAGLHVNTVRKLVNNKTASFSLVTIEKLYKYLFGEKA